MFGTANSFSPASTLFSSPTPSATTNINKDYELPSPPDDTVQALRFSPPSVPQNFLASGSWDGLVRVWEVSIPALSSVPVVSPNLQALPKAQQTAGGPVLDVCYSDVSLFPAFLLRKPDFLC